MRLDEFIDKIICGDCLKMLSKLPDDSIDIVLTSPPYNYGMDYDSYDDKIGWNQYFEWIYDVFVECVRVVKDGGRIIVVIKPCYTDNIPTHHRISQILENLGMTWKTEIIWEQNNYSQKITSWGSWQSPSNPYIKTTWEFIEVFFKGSARKEGEKDDIDITGEEFKKWIYGRWSLAPEGKMKQYGHPAMFPEDVVERILKLFSYRNDVVLDPFVGTGTTAVVAKKLERKFIGIDISDRYCRIANERLSSIQQYLFM